MDWSLKKVASEPWERIRPANSGMAITMCWYSFGKLLGMERDPSSQNGAYYPHIKIWGLGFRV